jgi:hypothetical protein
LPELAGGYDVMRAAKGDLVTDDAMFAQMRSARGQVTGTAAVDKSSGLIADGTAPDRP